MKGSVPEGGSGNTPCHLLPLLCFLSLSDDWPLLLKYSSLGFWVAMLSCVVLCCVVCFFLPSPLSVFLLYLNFTEIFWTSISPYSSQHGLIISPAFKHYLMATKFSIIIHMSQRPLELCTLPTNPSFLLDSSQASQTEHFFN